MGGEECGRNVGIRRDHTGDEDVLLIHRVCRAASRVRREERTQIKAE